MKQRFLDPQDHDLIVKAIMDNFEGKWMRSDHVRMIEIYAGIPIKEMMHQRALNEVHYQVEAANAIALEVENRIEAFLESDDVEDLGVNPVLIRPRVDGLSGKTRNICMMDPFHQIYGHVVCLALRPMLMARLLPFQHASIPGHGQTRLKDQVYKLLRKGVKTAREAVQADVHKAYESTMYTIVLMLLRRDLPRARKVHRLVDGLGRLAPGGHLIIGGYLDAWMFNYVMSHVLNYLLSQYKMRRGKNIRLVKAIQSYMDDVAVFGTRLADLKKALRATGRWMEPLGLEWKDSFKVIRFLPFQEEHARRKAQSPAGRGCPGLDMGGYVMHRSYITIRPRIFKKARRALIRAERRRKTGICHVRAQRVMAYYGNIKQSTSETLKESYDVARLKTLCAASIGWWSRRQMRIRQEALKRYA